MTHGAIRKVAIVGSGVMGPGIAQTFARGGLDVFLVDQNQEILGRGLRQIRENLDLFIEMEIIRSEQAEDVLSRIHPTTDLETACREADYFMEAVQEILDLKQQIHRQADEWCAPHVILASNASNIKIEQIASVTGRPDRVVGTHWVNPPHIMQLVEIVRSPYTSEGTIETVYNLLESVGKAPIVCKDTLQYLNNAMQSAITRVALDLLEKDVATADHIDKAVNTGFGFRLPIVGPLAFLDMAGLDNVRDGWKYMDKMTGGARGPLPGKLKELVEKGHLGIKTGKGIFEYAEKASYIVKERNRLLILQLKALGRI
jgi:3-hydroxybutyryl-CoA dehydrogenase